MTLVPRKGMSYVPSYAVIPGERGKPTYQSGSLHLDLQVIFESMNIRSGCLIAQGDKCYIHALRAFNLN